MVREIITINIGSCGIYLGDTVWKQFCNEHGIHPNGQKIEQEVDTSYKCIFEQIDAQQYIARNLMIDLDPNIIDNIQISKYRNIYNPEFLISGKEDASNIYSRGYYSIGKPLIDDIQYKIHKLIENCDNTQGFIINHSMGGGTGSGLTSLILQKLSNEYPHKTKVCLFFISFI